MARKISRQERASGPCAMEKMTVVTRQPPDRYQVARDIQPTLASEDYVVQSGVLDVLAAASRSLRNPLP